MLFFTHLPKPGGFEAEGVASQVEKLRWVSLCGAVLVFVSLLVLWRLEGDPKYGTVRYAVLMSLFAVCSWCFILAALGLGLRHLRFTNSFVRYSNEAVLPFYVLHQAVILTVGYLVVRSAIPDLVKFVIIAVCSFSLIAAVYEFGIRRNNLLRFLFGMKPRPSVPPEGSGQERPDYPPEALASRSRPCD